VNSSPAGVFACQGALPARSRQESVLAAPRHLSEYAGGIAWTYLFGLGKTIVGERLHIFGFGACDTPLGLETPRLLPPLRSRLWEYARRSRYSPFTAVVGEG
jgi:hypothetical protein